MTYEEYYEATMEYLNGTCKDYKEVFEEGNKMRRAIEAAINRAALGKWFGNEEGDS